ncbi:MAG: DUF2141 domain-containing protein [Pikeienuella sp.]
MAGTTLALLYVFLLPTLLGNELKIQVDGLRSTKGVVHILVYDDETAFAGSSTTDITAWASEAPTGERMVVSVGWLPPGRYAIVLHHDENADQVMNMENGLPIEGYAYSNNVGGQAEPKFSDAAFTFEQAHTLKPMKMIYLN